jgi:hypothetical protein
VAADAALELADLPRLALDGALQIADLVSLSVAIPAGELPQLSLFVGCCFGGVAATTAAVTSVLFGGCQEV